jgi:hypothetical protein
MDTRDFDSPDYYSDATGLDDGGNDYDDDDYSPTTAEEIATDGDEEFCNGMSMTMSMGGFQSSFLGKQKADCLTYLFKNWVLNTSGKFQGAMGTFLFSFGCLSPILSVLRARSMMPFIDEWQSFEQSLRPSLFLDALSSSVSSIIASSFCYDRLLLPPSQFTQSYWRSFVRG